MGLLEFNKLPINTLVGADWKTFKAITAGREIDAAYKGKYRLTKAVCRLLSPLPGEAELRLYIMYSLVISILGITLLIRLYFLI